MNGKKTYTISAGIVLSALGLFLSGEMALADAVTAALTGLGLAGIRHGVTTETKSR